MHIFLHTNTRTPIGETALTMAAKNEDISILSLLVSHPRVDIGAKSASSGLRAIHVAAMERNVLAVRLLLTVTQGTNPQQFVQELKGVANEEPANYLMLEIQRLQTMLGAQYEEYNTDIEVLIIRIDINRRSCPGAKVLRHSHWWQPFPYVLIIAVRLKYI